MPAAPVGSCTAAVSPSRRALMQERPAAAPRGHRPQAQEMAQAVRLRRRSLRRSALQGGWHGVLQSCLPGPCCLCRLPHAVSPCLRTATCVARRTVRGSDSLAVCRRPACGRRDVPAPLRCRTFQGLPRSRRFSPGMPRPEDRRQGRAPSLVASMVPWVRFVCFVRCGATSSTHAPRGTGGWLNLPRWGLPPHKKRQASLGALTPGFRRGWQRERGTSGRCQPSPANPCSAVS